MFQGNNVKDEHGNWAIFADLGSSPASMEAARAADAYGLFPGHAIQQSDAEQAYTQAWLRGIPLGFASRETSGLRPGTMLE